MFNKMVLIAYVIWIVLASLCAFFLYLLDKKKASNNSGANIIKEKTLLSISCMGGGIGSFFGRIVAHHKTNKVYFTLVINLSVLVQIIGFVVLLLLAI